MKSKALIQYFFIGWIILFSTQTLWSQQATSTALVDKDTYMIGDPITLKIVLNIPGNVKIQHIDLNIYKNIQNLDYTKDTLRYDNFADVEILDYGNWQPSTSDPLMIPSSSIKASQDGKIENTIQIAIYNEGAFSIPGPSFVADPTIDLLPSNGQIIKVNISEKVLSDSLALHPIKDIMVEEANLSDYLTYIYIFLAALILAGIGYYFYKRKKNTNQTVVAVEPEIILTADEKAIAALTQLKNKSLWQQGEIKEYQSSLTDIIRTYLQDRYGVDAMEMTTDEISRALSQTDFDKQYKDSLREILQVADLVKFAKATPSENIHQIFMDKAVDFVVNTKEVIKPKTSET